MLSGCFTDKTNIVFDTPTLQVHSETTIIFRRYIRFGIATCEQRKRPTVGSNNVHVRVICRLCERRRYFRCPIIVFAKRVSTSPKIAFNFVTILQPKAATFRKMERDSEP